MLHFYDRRAQALKAQQRVATSRSCVSALCEELGKHLTMTYPEGVSVGEMEQLDLKEFPNETSEIVQTSALRLRLLAIHLEDSAYLSKRATFTSMSDKVWPQMSISGRASLP